MKTDALDAQRNIMDTRVLKVTSGKFGRKERIQENRKTKLMETRRGEK